MRTVGIVGIESSHADHFTRLLNVDHRHPDYRVSALVAGEPERTRELRAAGGPSVEQVVDRVDDLVGLVDVAIISSRDGADHLAHATPLLEAGIPVLVDKPLAASVADAEQILACAERHGTPIVSLSALRGVPELALIRDGRDGLGTLLSLQVVGSGSASSPYSGLWFYGIHHIETALEVCGPTEIGEVSVNVVPNLISAATTLGSVAVTLTFVDDAVGHAPWSATAVGTDGTVHTPLTLGPDYAAPVLDAFVEMVDTGRQPYTADELLQPITLLSRIDDQRTKTASRREEQQ